jgi:peptidoglycan/LPS O-acetylase OafA/YrhL
MDSKRASRLSSIDGLRGVLAMVVVYEHTRGCLLHGHTDSPGQFAVMAFFMMSGYVLTRGWNGDFLPFLAKRFVRLWPLFALTFAIGALIRGDAPAWTYFFWYPFVCDPVKSSVLLANSPMWSQFVEAWAALFMPLIVWTSRSTMRVIAAMAIAMVCFRFDRCFLYAALFIVGAFFSTRDFNLPLLNGRALQWLGRISYSLYLTHSIVLDLCDRYLPGAAWLEIPVALAVAHVVWLVVDRPSVRASRWVGRATGHAKAAVLDAIRRRAGSPAGAKRLEAGGLP